MRWLPVQVFGPAYAFASQAPYAIATSAIFCVAFEIGMPAEFWAKANNASSRDERQNAPTPNQIWFQANVCGRFTLWRGGGQRGVNLSLDFLRPNFIAPNIQQGRRQSATPSSSHGQGTATYSMRENSATHRPIRFRAATSSVLRPLRIDQPTAAAGELHRPFARFFRP